MRNESVFVFRGSLRRGSAEETGAMPLGHGEAKMTGQINRKTIGELACVFVILGLVGLVLLLFGCNGLRSGQKARADRDVIQTTEQREQTETVEVKTARDVTATYHALDEQRRKLEESRLRDRRQFDAQMGLMIAGVLIVFLVAPALGPEWFRPYLWIAGVGAILAGWLLPVLVGIFV